MQKLASLELLIRSTIILYNFILHVHLLVCQTSAVEGLGLRSKRAQHQHWGKYLIEFDHEGLLLVIHVSTSCLLGVSS